LTIGGERSHFRATSVLASNYSLQLSRQLYNGVFARTPLIDQFGCQSENAAERDKRRNSSLSS